MDNIQSTLCSHSYQGKKAVLDNQGFLYGSFWVFIPYIFVRLVFRDFLPFTLYAVIN